MDLICITYSEPRNNLVFEDLEKIVQLEQTMYGVQQDPDFNLTSVMVNCHNNHTIYEVNIYNTTYVYILFCFLLYMTHYIQKVLLMQIINSY